MIDIDFENNSDYVDLHTSELTGLIYSVFMDIVDVNNNG